jgi:hypothetical protein
MHCIAVAHLPTSQAWIAVFADLQLPMENAWMASAQQ